MRGIGILLAVAVLMAGAASANAAGIKQYKTETGAQKRDYSSCRTLGTSTRILPQKHCPGDTVVWGSSRGGVYHTKGTKSYAKSKRGKYVCMAEANSAGWHPAKNNQ